MKIDISGYPGVVFLVAIYKNLERQQENICTCKTDPDDQKVTKDAS
jgi:hypothetical protein